MLNWCLNFIVLQDVPTRQFDFYVEPATPTECPPPTMNAFQVLAAGASREPIHMVLPPPRQTIDNTADDIVHNDILAWFKTSQVGWPRNQVETLGRDFVNKITSDYFPSRKACWSKWAIKTMQVRLFRIFFALVLADIASPLIDAIDFVVVALMMLMFPWHYVFVILQWNTSQMNADLDLLIENK